MRRRRSAPCPRASRTRSWASTTPSPRESKRAAITSPGGRSPRWGVPASPRAWLVSAGRFKAIDAMRRRARFDASLEEIARRFDVETSDPVARDGESVEDDRLRLRFTCCHPALPPDAQIALTLREVCGLTPEP